MTHEVPFVTAICPTYHRPKCLQNAIACFESQDYPKDRCELLIYDDAGQYDSQTGKSWRLFSTRQRESSLPEKFNRMILEMADPRSEFIVLWEDDDFFLPWHLTAQSAALRNSLWCRPTRAFSNYKQQRKAVQLEDATGRFHGAWAFHRQHFITVGGYPKTREISFDMQFGQRLSGGRSDWYVPREGTPGDTCQDFPPSYVYCWGNPYYHGSAVAGDFYSALKDAGDATRFHGTLKPVMDLETQRLYQALTFNVAAAAQLGDVISTDASYEPIHSVEA